MLSNYSSYLKSKWRQICSTLAVLLMFLIPATRAVFATQNHPDSGEHRDHHSHPGNSRGCSRPTRSTPPPVSPVHPPSHSGSGASRH